MMRLSIWCSKKAKTLIYWMRRMRRLYGRQRPYAASIAAFSNHRQENFCVLKTGLAICFNGRHGNGVSQRVGAGFPTGHSRTPGAAHPIASAANAGIDSSGVQRLQA
jgi:hypothetical protein